MVCIGTYKKKRMYYDEGKFFVINKDKTRTESDNETGLKSKIDLYISEETRRKDMKKLEKDAAKLEARRKSIYYIFDAEELKRFFKRIALFQYECRLSFEDKQMTCIAMDPANVAMIRRVISYKKKSKTTLPTKVCVNANTCYKMIITMKDEINLHFDIGKIVLRNGSEEVSIPTIELTERDQKAPDLKFNVNAFVKYRWFNQRVMTANRIGAESVKFLTTDKGSFSLFAETEYNTVKSIDKVIATNNAKDMQRAKYSAEYLKKDFFGSTKKEDTTVLIEYSTDYPLKMLDTLGNWLILAPRVDND